MAKAKGPSNRRPRPPELKVTPGIHDDDQRLELLERLNALIEYKVEWEGWTQCPHCEAGIPPSEATEPCLEGDGSGI